ncbi:hypothetical protein M1247_29610 [Mycobacterium sp. 21AC1]|uniref:hypothetical protein n=1 Tax=[Mycobacterium] appelbergii TaxID=2939269 RepID=UPI00293909E2|nr:hypothetical protein [Mycobacterium sp. 21AC1]MDV3129095.1 hypothetical protein [Mycobacterium sp. 21AC1]
MIVIHDERGDVHVGRQQGGARLIEIRRVLGNGKVLRLILNEALAIAVSNALVDITEADE